MTERDYFIEAIKFIRHYFLCSSMKQTTPCHRINFEALITSESTSRNSKIFTFNVMEEESAGYRGSLAPNKRAIIEYNLGDALNRLETEGKATVYPDGYCSIKKKLLDNEIKLLKDIYQALEQFPLEKNVRRVLFSFDGNRYILKVTKNIHYASCEFTVNAFSMNSFRDNIFNLLYGKELNA